MKFNSKIRNIGTTHVIYIKAEDRDVAQLKFGDSVSVTIDRRVFKRVLRNYGGNVGFCVPKEHVRGLKLEIGGKVQYDIEKSSISPILRGTISLTRQQILYLENPANIKTHAEKLRINMALKKKGEQLVILLAHFKERGIKIDGSVLDGIASSASKDD